MYYKDQAILAAREILESGITTEEFEEEKRYAARRETEYEAKIRYIEHGRFIPVEDTEFDGDFEKAARVLLPYYRTPYYGHNAEGARHCTAMRLLEMTDERYARFWKLHFGFSLSNVYGDESLTEADKRKRLEDVAANKLEEEK